MGDDGQDRDKRLAAEAAVGEVVDGMLVGLGTGSTAAHAIRALGARVRDGLRVEAVATSQASERLAVELGIRVHPFDTVAAVDLTIDGADEIDGRLRTIKGAGGAMLREKIVAAASTRMVVVADGSKRVDAIGAAKVPVEVLPFALRFVTARLEAVGAAPVLRLRDGEPWVTDNGNRVVDCALWDVPERAAAALDAIPGVMGHGLFLEEVDAAYIATGGIVARLERDGGSG
jgi:ribose 5-phosphate isomerase A